jgi:cytochrome c biogenesis protein CcmG, thiol:disulfide interchange protein DsbE
MRWLGLASLTTLLLTVASCPKVREAHADCREAEDKCRPQLSATTLNGGELAEHDLVGKVVLVNFWATWCHPCVEEIPLLEATWQRHKGDGFVVVGILAAEPADDAQVQQFMADHGITYPVIRAGDGMLRQFEMGSTLPVSFVYDRAGRLVLRKNVELRAPELDPLVARLIKAGGSR